MSNDWRTQYRLFLDDLEATLYRIIGDEPTDLAIVEEQTAQLLTAVAGLLRQHDVNKRGQCNVYGWTHWWLRACRRRPQCTVFRNLSFAMGQPLDVALWYVFAIFGNNTTLEEVRECDRATALFKSSWSRRLALSETDTVVVTAQVILASAQ